MSRIYCGRWQDSIPASGHPVSMVQALPRDVITLEQLASIFRHTCRFSSFISHINTKLSNNKIPYMILIQIGFQNSFFLLHYLSTIFGDKVFTNPTILTCPQWLIGWGCSINTACLTYTFGYL